MADHADLAVHSFHRSIGETPLEEATDPRPVGMKGLSESLERGQLRPPRPGEPISEFTFGASNARTRKDSLEGLLQQVGSVETFVGLLHAGQLGLLLPGEVPWVFQQGPSARLQRGSQLPLSSLELCAAHVVDGAIEKLNDMKAVVDDLGVRKPLLDGLLERLIHVDRDDEDLFSLLVSELFEEMAKRGRVLSLMGPDPRPLS